MIIVIEAIDGAGKCFGRNTAIMMYDGSVKKVQDVLVGDLVMGNDSTPRRVKKLARGCERLYRVTSKRGNNSYVVNESHILVFRVAGKRTNLYAHLKDKDGLVKITVREYLKLSRCCRRHLMGLRAAVKFPKIPVKIDPYILGIWLGDGHSETTAVSTADNVIKEALYREAKDRGLKITIHAQHKTSPQYRLHAGVAGLRENNSLRNDLKHYDLLNNKHIPADYLTNSRSVRLALLAGLLDSDGHLNKKSGFDFINKNKNIAFGVFKLARSLGFYASVVSCKKRCQTGAVGKYYRVGIFGDLENIPVKISYKQAYPRRKNKNVLHFGVNIKSIGSGEYYGFSVDKNHLFLLEDFTVVHNSTQIEALTKRYTPKYRKVESLHFPVYNTLTGQAIKNLLEQGNPDSLVLQCMMVANRLEMFRMLDEYATRRSWPDYDPNLIILDRYNPSAIAYGLADGLPRDFLDRIHESLPQADHNFLLDISVEESFRRRPERQDAYETNKGRLEKARKNYLEVFSTSGDNYHILDGTQPRDVVTQQIINVIEEQ